MIAQHPSFRIESRKTSLEMHFRTYCGARGDEWKKHAKEVVAVKEKETELVYL